MENANASKIFIGVVIRVYAFLIATKNLLLRLYILKEGFFCSSANVDSQLFGIKQEVNVIFSAIKFNIQLGNTNMNLYVNVKHIQIGILENSSVYLIAHKYHIVQV